MRPDRTAPVAGLAALPDDVSLARLAALVGATGANSYGHNGTIGYDKGDPAHSLGGPLATVAAGAPAASLAEVTAGNAAPFAPNPTIGDGLLGDPNLASYRRSMLARVIG